MAFIWQKLLRSSLLRIETYDVFLPFARGGPGGVELLAIILRVNNEFLIVPVPYFYLPLDSLYKAGELFWAALFTSLKARA